MAIAIEVRRVQQSVPASRFQPIQFIQLSGRRLWWHTHAYSVVFGILILTGLALGGLWLQRLLVQILKPRKQPLQSSQENA